MTVFDDIIAKTDTDFASWTIIEATNKEYATSKIVATVVDRLSAVLQQKTDFARIKVLETVVNALEERMGAMNLD